MELLEKENAVRRVLGNPEVEILWDDGGCKYPSDDDWYPAYYGEENSIGLILRDVVPRLTDIPLSAVFAGDGSGTLFDAAHDLVKWPDLAAMPAACCDALLRKEGILT